MLKLCRIGIITNHVELELNGIKIMRKKNLKNYVELELCYNKIKWKLCRIVYIFVNLNYVE